MDITTGVRRRSVNNPKIPECYPEMDELKKQYYINYTIAMAEIQELLEKVRECANAAVETVNSRKDTDPLRLRR